MAVVAILVVATVASGVEKSKARKEEAKAARNESEARKIRFEAEQKQARAEQRIREVQEKRERVKAVRQARRARADLQTSAEASGVGSSSSAFGAVGSVRTQTGQAVSTSRIIGGIQSDIVQSNLAAGERVQSFLDLATENKINANAARGRAGFHSSVASIASSAA